MADANYSRTERSDLYTTLFDMRASDDGWKKHKNIAGAKVGGTLWEIQSELKGIR